MRRNSCAAAAAGWCQLLCCTPAAPSPYAAALASLQLCCGHQSCPAGHESGMRGGPRLAGGHLPQRRVSEACLGVGPAAATDALVLSFVLRCPVLTSADALILICRHLPACRCIPSKV